MSSHPKARKNGVVRIIGGNFRSRNLHFEGVRGLRPTPDRVRETLFNWLSPYLAGADCLDLFAGTGVLGLEALSRGAASTTFVENHPRTFDCLTRNIELLGVDNARTHRQSAWTYLGRTTHRFDIIFLDPPFDTDAPARVLNLLLENNLLKPRALIYLEHRTGDRRSEPAKIWQKLRSTRAGDVTCHLLEAPNHIT